MSLALLALPACVAVPAASAAPVSLTLNYTCNFPLMDPQPLALKIDADIPASLPAETATGSFDIKAAATVSAAATKGLRALDARTLKGSAIAYAVVTPASGPPLDVEIETTVPEIAIPATGGLVANATGDTPSLFPSKPGTMKFNVGDLVLTMDPEVADGTPTGLAQFETECTLVPGQNTLLGTINITAKDKTAPTAPADLKATAAETSVSLSWTPSTDDVGVTGYDVFQDGQKVATSTTPNATVGNLAPNSTHTFKVQARDASGKTSGFSNEVSATTTGGAFAFAYSFKGTAAIKTLTKGNVALTGNYDFTLARETGAITANLAINQATARLTAIGFLPVSAKLAFLQSGQSTGTFKDGVLTSTSRVRIKVPEVKLFGAIPLAGGNNCQTKQLSDITLKSAAGFDPAKGGTVSGTFSLSDLNGCGVLNGLVSPLTAGGGNTISLQLAPKPIA